MIAEWGRQALALLEGLAGHPAGGGPFWIVAGAALLAGLVAMSLLGSVLHNPNSTVFGNLFHLLFATALAVAAALAARRFAGAGPALQAAAAALAVLAIAAPLLAWRQRTGYGTALVALLGAFAVAILVAVLARAVLGGVAGGRRGAERARDRRDTVEQMLSH